MERGDMNNIVAKELSEALAKCQQQGIDASTLRTGLLTITIANFVNGIGIDNTISLFSVLPEQIQSGLFHKFAGKTPPAPQTKERAPLNPQNPMRPTAVSQYSPEASPFAAPPAESTPIKRRRL